MSILDQHAAARRDFRHDHGTREVPPLRGKRKRKVCKKSPDREHAYAPKERSLVDGFVWETCTHCGKYK